MSLLQEGTFFQLEGILQMQKGRELLRHRTRKEGHIYRSLDWSCYRLLCIAAVKSFWSVTFWGGLFSGASKLPVQSQAC
jgi:hypothetical protein